MSNCDCQRTQLQAQVVRSSHLTGYLLNRAIFKLTGTSGGREDNAAISSDKGTPDSTPSEEPNSATSIRPAEQSRQETGRLVGASRRAARAAAAKLERIPACQMFLRASERARPIS